MKTIKFLLVSLFMMLGTSAFAQGVVVHKSDGATEIIHDVDSVAYETADIGYYGLVTYEDATTLTEFTPELFTTKLYKTRGIDIVPETGKNLIVLTTNNVSPVIRYTTGGIRSNPRNAYPGNEWEVSNTVQKNGKTYYFWIFDGTLVSSWTDVILDIE